MDDVEFAPIKILTPRIIFIMSTCHSIFMYYLWQNPHHLYSDELIFDLKNLLLIERISFPKKFILLKKQNAYKWNL